MTDVSKNGEAPSHLSNVFSSQNGRTEPGRTFTGHKSLEPSGDDCPNPPIMHNYKNHMDQVPVRA
jgi:hypothetical protein